MKQAGRKLLGRNSKKSYGGINLHATYSQLPDLNRLSIFILLTVTLNPPPSPNFLLQKITFLKNETVLIYEQYREFVLGLI